MKQGLYAVYDEIAASIHGGIMMFSHDAPAMRFFEDLCKDERTNIAKHLTDYKLIHIGDIDDQTAMLQPGGGYTLHGTQIDTLPLTRDVLTGRQWKALHDAPGENEIQARIEARDSLPRGR